MEVSVVPGSNPIRYIVDGKEIEAIEHNHLVCDEGCTVPCTIKYVEKDGEKKYVQNDSNFFEDCECWKAEGGE